MSGSGSASVRPEVWSRDAVSWLSNGFSGFSVADWVLIALAGAALYWVWASLRAATRVGPIEVELLECDGGSQAKVHALTAMLRERLANSGLPPPPAVPAGAPQADLIAAVTASPIPQGAWIATLLRLLPTPPRPPQYKLSGTVFGDDGRRGCGISFWLQPSREGRELLQTVEALNTHRDVIGAAASSIYLHISNDAVHAFPIWARWRDAQALDAYSQGRKLATKRELDGALEWLCEAARREPGNAIAQLQLANLCEQMAIDKPSLQADALRRYLDVAVEWPWLVQARYRVSVLAAVLACSHANWTEQMRDDVVTSLKLPGVNMDTLQASLQDLANRESEAVLQLLQPWYALLKQQRLRYQFEPRGEERRDLKRSVNISQHCMRIRQTFGDQGGWRVWLKTRYSALAVHRWHLSAFRGGVSWQTHYLAACFDALLLEREQQSTGN
jgi:hypothetical protein